MINRKKIKRELLTMDMKRIPKKIAVLCGSTLGEFIDALEIYLLRQNILPEFWIGGYNRYFEDAVFNDALAAFKPDVIYIHTTQHNLLNLPEMSDSDDIINEKLNKESARWHQIWDVCGERCGCTIIQNNFDLPPERVLGPLDGINFHGKLRFIRALNEHFADAALTKSSLYIHDINYLSAAEGLDSWHNASYMHLYKYAVSPGGMDVLAKSLSSLLNSLFGGRKKCLVLDLDNTLWGGIVGEAGPEQIEIGAGSPIGEAFAAFQRYLKQLSESGILLCAASKNEEEAAKSGFTAPGSVLSEADFACFYANWLPKDVNIQNMAKTLNLGLDSFVFIDDNPAERELIRNRLPQVAVIEAERPEKFLYELDRSGYFDTLTLSAEDTRRADLYKENQQRESEKNNFASYADYLISLEQTCLFTAASEKNLERVVQLAGKTNQFNLTTWRITTAELIAIASDPAYITICGSLKDKFGDNGLVTVLIGKIENDTLDILLWIMSCRVFSRRLEFAVFDKIISECEKRGIFKIKGVYKPTAKNKPVAGFYAGLNFEKSGENENGDSFWAYLIQDDYKPMTKEIEIIDQGVFL